MRVRKEFERPDGKNLARLVVIATEGKTEQIYFKALKEKKEAKNVHVEILTSDEEGNNNPDPNSVFERLSKFMLKYEIADDDGLWLVIDRDRWLERTFSSLARKCHQNPNLKFCVSNPAFELWLMLHLIGFEELSEQEKSAIKTNRKQRKGGVPFLKKKMRELLGSYNESNYNTESLLRGRNVDLAIERAILLDTNPADRWPNTVGTRVYLLAKSIIGI